MLEKIHCHICDFACKTEARFRQHLTNVHSISDIKAEYDKLNGEPPSCHCGCGTPLKWLGWKHGYAAKYVRGHNAQIDTIFNDVEKNKQLAEKRKIGYRTGKYKVWNKGITAETDERIKKSADKIGKTLRARYSSGELTSWQTGKTKDDHPSLKKSSETKLKRFALGEVIPWSKGLTKENNDSLRKASNRALEYYSSHASPVRRTEEELRSIFQEYSNKFELVSDIRDYKDKRHKFAFRCTVCGDVALKTIYMLTHCPLCFSCNPRSSKQQIEIADFIKALGFQVIENDRQQIHPLEIDIFVPSKMFGLEFNGLYWHSTGFHSDQNYHDQKVCAAAEKNIRLMHVFEDEWEEKSEILKSMIKHRLGLSQNRISARECDVVKIDPVTRKEFFVRTHLDGDVKSSFCYGLVRRSDKKLVAAASFRRPFHKKYSQMCELARFSTELDTVVRGGLSKLMTAYKREFPGKDLVSYLDTRFGGGDLYLHAGFKDMGTTSPRFWWTDYQKRYDRFKIRADRSRNLSEAHVAEANGVHRIYGCKNRIFILQCSIGKE